MLDKLRFSIIPHLIGLCLIVLGWYISILNVGLSRFQENVLFTKWTLIGLGLILLGAYMPNITGIFRKQ